MSRLLIYINGSESRDHLVRLEAFVLILNVALGLLCGIPMMGGLILLVLGGLAIYRICILSGLKDGETLFCWWYCVANFLFCVRFSILLVAQHGTGLGPRFRIAQDMVPAYGLPLILLAMGVRTIGLTRTFLVDLNRRQRLTASIAMGSGMLACFYFLGGILILTAFETIFYGFELKLH